MLKINQKIKNKFDLLLNILVLILLIFFNSTNIVYGANTTWIEVSRTPTGIQYLDRDSINIEEKGIIELTTKYIKIAPSTSKEIEENIYIMKINCMTNKFKDISVNGKKNLSAKWEDPNGDKLLDDVISDSCENV
ncbi:hypothetical protein DNJ72_03845 [Prochlorococcus marinus XMU1403]|uniref:hypothetical protein n=1 Tax=Prochlorococcus marinus TaxID=1219 RepID=UPI000D8CFAB1|nr:hypothetical protein [Prochlorococcus marinus]MBW3049217.1 hypothetical protein [Prochlorococcus marinus str. MU1403]PYE02180.1 hypothetical protein DNJ72_03845 [Prochlorococcus marinus XMU1403]